MIDDDDDTEDIEEDNRITKFHFIFIQDLFNGPYSANNIYVLFEGLKNFGDEHLK